MIYLSASWNWLKRHMEGLTRICCNRLRWCLNRSERLNKLGYSLNSAKAILVALLLKDEVKHWFRFGRFNTLSSVSKLWMHFGLGDLKVEEFSSKLDSELQSSKSKEKQLRSFAKIFKYNFNNSKVFGFNKKLFSVYYVRVGLETAIV